MALREFWFIITVTEALSSTILQHKSHSEPYIYASASKDLVASILFLSHCIVAKKILDFL